jgi:Kef-type K+ transport system membrane component KefB
MSAEALTGWLLLDLALITVAAAGMGALFRRFKMPPVIGEICAGIALGPTLLGALPGNLTDSLFSPEARGALRIIGELGLAVFMFTIGWSLDLHLIGRAKKTAAAISFGSASLPFALGLALAVLLHPAHEVVDGQPVPLLPFALFVGAAMSITAFPVLARILVDRGMERSRVGNLLLSCAAIDDLVGWTLVAIVVAVVASSGAWDVATMFAELLAFVLVMWFVGRPLLARALRVAPSGAPAEAARVAALLVGGALTCAWITDSIGLHLVFGAFVFGLVLPRRAGGALEHVRGQLDGVVALLLPVYFILPGLSVDLSGLTGTAAAEFAAVFLVACLGKFGGAIGAARLRGVGWQDSLTIATLMNTRGLIEIVVLTIGLQAGVIDGQLFTVMVLMAIGTTLMAGPALRLIHRRAPPDAFPVAPPLAPAGRRPALPGNVAMTRTVPRAHQSR